MKYKKNLNFSTVKGIDTDWDEKAIRFMDAYIGLYVDELLIWEDFVIEDNGDVEFVMRYTVW
jgi:hypothetical protein